MATDSTILPQGEAHLDSDTDMSGSELDLTSVQLAQVEGAQPVELPRGNQVVLVPVQPGQTIELPVDSASGLLAKIGPEGNLAIVVDGRTIILQGYLNANEQSPVKVVTNDGDSVDVTELVAATDPSLDIQTAAGPAAGAQGDTTQGSGIFIPFAAGGGLGGFGAEGVLGATALQYKLIDDERKEDVRDTGPTSIDITFDILGGIINEDDLPADENGVLQLASFGLGGFGFGAGYGTDGRGNDEFDTKDREDQPGSPDDVDGVDDNGAGVDPDREPLVSVATVKVNFGPDVPGTLTIDTSKLPTNLTSEGQPIVYEVVPAGGGVGTTIRGFVDGGGDPTKFDSIFDRPVFSIQVQEESSNSEFHVWFTLYDNLDNAAPDQNKDGEPDLLGADEQILGLPVHMTATDSDGSPLSTTMDLGVKDDRPFFGKVVLECDSVDIVQTDADITHDETPGVQPHSDDVSIFNYYVAQLGLQLAEKVDNADFDFPFGESKGALIGAAKTKLYASFGADGPTEEHYKDADDKDARNSVFGELQDRTDADGDGIDNGENERPFELFMVSAGTAVDSAENPLGEGDLTIADQQTNATVTWDGKVELPVYIHQIDAQTIVGYVMPCGPEGEKVAVFALNVDDQGCLSFFQIHQLNHDVDGKYFPQHDDALVISDPDGNPLIYVRATDYDGDHAIQPVNLVVEDDGPRFCEVDWGCDDDSARGVGLIDEDRLPHGNYGGPGDDKGGTHTDGKVVFDFGVDQPGHLEINELTVKDCTGKTVLEVCLDQNGCLKIGENCLEAIDGREITVEKSGPNAHGVVTWTAYIADCPGEKVFSFSLDTKGHNIGEFDFCLYQPLEHPDTNGVPWDNNWDNGKGSFEDNFKFDFKVRGYDSDGDYADGNVKLSVDDDSPDPCKVEISFCDEDNKLVHDETGGVQIGGKWFPWDYDPDASRQPEDDTWYVRDFGKFEQEEHCLDRIGYAKTELKIDLSGGSYCEDAAFGADGPGHVSPVSLVTCNGGDFCGEKTNLTDTKTGCAIFLYTEEVCGETYVVGRVGGKDGPVSFALTVSDCGDLELAQYRAIQHPDGCDSDESLSLLDCFGNALIHLQVKVTDADGDAVYARQPVDGCDGNPSIVFQDDGPTVCATDCKLTLAMDETSGYGHDPYDYDQPGYYGIKDGRTPENDEDLNKFAVIFSGLPECPETIGAAKDNVQKLFSVDFGTDDGCVVCYELTVLDACTNLRDTQTGTLITLCKDPCGIVKGVDGCGNIVFAVWLDADSGKIVSAQYRAIDHGDGERAPGAHDEVKYLEDCSLGVTATAFDKDGDHDSKTVDISKAISFDDDGPRFCETDWGDDRDSKHGKGVIDEEALRHGIPDGPGDDRGGKHADGKVVFDFGNDKAGHLEIRELTVCDPSGKTVLEICVDECGDLVVKDNCLFAIDNKALCFEKCGPDGDGVVTWTAFIEGCPDQKVFTFSLDTCGDCIGQFDFCLLSPLEHPDTNNRQYDNNWDNGKGSFEDNFKFDFKVRGYDGDGDSADGNVKLSVDDDSPDACKVEISFCDEDNKLVHDETGGVQIGGKWFPWDYDPDASRQPEDDTWYVRDFGKFEQEEHCLDRIGYAKTELKIDLSGGSYCEDAAFGADGPGHVSPVSLVTCNGGDFCGEKTNLTDTKTGCAIFLYTEEVCGETYVVGRVGGKDGEVSFALTVADCGDLELAQYRAIQHPDGCDSDESLTLLDCEGNALIHLQVKVTDADGDAVIARQAVDGCDGNPSIVFQDDGPTVCATDCKLTLAMDETDRFQLFPHDDDQPGYYGIKDGSTPEGDPLSNVSILLNAIFPGSVPYLLGAACDNVEKLFKIDFGTDDGCEVCYDLTILCEKTNLRDTETGTCISLEDCGNGIVKGVDECGNVVFAVWLDHDSGEIVTTQFRAIDHGDGEHAPGAHDEVRFLGDDILGVTATAFDKDGDKDSKTVDIGCGIAFEDDGPKFCGTEWGDDRDSKDGIGLIDEDALPKGVAGGPGDDEGGKHADGKVVFDIGSDQPGHLEINGLEVKDCTGKTVLEICVDECGDLVVKDNCLFAIDNKALCFEKCGPDGDGVVTWTAFIAGCPDQKVFTFSLDTCGDCIGQFEFCLLQPLEHPLTTDPSALQALTQQGSGAYEDNFKFDFTIRGYDGDGDSADGHVKLSVDDDSPTVTDCGCETNLLVNGSFEDLGTEDGGTLENGTWGVFSQIPGWKSGADESNPSGLPGLEIQNASAVGLTAKDGNYYVELDSDNLDQSDPAPSTTNASIYQDVSTVDGNNYVLSFSYSPRTGDESTDGIEVWFDGAKIATIDSGTVGQWTEHTFVVQAGEGDATPDLSRLEFKAVGSANELGGFIDNVSLTACAVVDEDALPNGIEGGPGDDVGGACFSGSLGVSFGADGGKSIVFCEDGQPCVTSGGCEVKYEWCGNPDGTGMLVAYTGDDPKAECNWVFTVAVQDLCNGGEYKFTLLKAIDHPDTNDNPADDQYDDGKGKFEDNLILDLKFTATDNDCDSVEGHLKVNVDDDTPVVESCELATLSLAMDETDSFWPLLKDDDRPEPDGPQDGPAQEVDLGEILSSFLGVIFPNVIPDVLGTAKGNVESLFKIDFGADGGCSVCYELCVQGDGKTNLIDTQTGSCVTLCEGPAGSVLGKNDDGDIVFAVWVNPDNGEIISAQLRAINHGGEEGQPGAYDEVKTLCEGVLGVKATATDKDGDADSKTVDIGKGISFEDDGPKVDIEKKRNAEIRLDESVGPGGAGDPNADDETTTPEDDIAYKKVSGSSLFQVETEDYGSDGAKSREFSLSINGNSDSGLIDVESGDPVQLSKNGNVITGTADGETVFTITIDPTNGDVAVQQFRAVKHNDPSDPDENGNNEPSTMSSNKLLLTLTITDGDCDSASDSIDLGKLIKFEDDGPKARNDTDHLETSDGGATFVATGNVYTGVGTDSGKVDDGGTDTPWIISKLEGAGGNDQTTGDGLVVTGLYGTLTLNPNTGDYTYDFDETKIGSVPEGAKEEFHYTLTDKDGDSDRAKLTIDLPSASVETSAVVGAQGAAFLKEDVYGPIALTATPGTGDTVTEIKLSNIPAGWDVKTGGGDIVLSSGTLGTVSFAGGVLTIQVTGAAAGAAITATIQVKAAEDSDVDGTGLTVSATAVDGPLTVSGSSNFDVTVDAILDEYLDVTAGAIAPVSESAASQLVGLNLSSAFAATPFANALAGGSDTDLSEVVNLSVTITVAGDAANLQLSAPIVGVTLVEGPAGVWTLTADTLGNLQSAISTLQADVPADFDGVINGSISVTTKEANTPEGAAGASGLEPDTSDNQVTDITNFSVTIDNSAQNAISDEICFSEDGVFNQYDHTLSQVQSLGEIFANVMTLGVDETLTALTISGLPAGASLSINGVAVAASGILTSQQVADWRGGHPIVVTPTADSDVDFDLSFSGTTTDGSSGAESPISGVVKVRVDAAADDPTGVTIDVVSTSGNEEFAQNETGTAKITATFGDTDGSETHTLTITAPAGFVFTSVANADSLPGPFGGLGTGTVTVTVPNTITSLDNLVLNVQAPAAFDGTPTFNVEAKAVETPIDGGCGPNDTDDTTNNVATETASDDVTFQADKAPVNYNDAKSGDEPGQEQNNVMIIFDHSGSMDDDADGNGPGTATRLQLARAAVEALLNKFDTLGDLKVKMVIFGTNATAMTFWGTAAQALAFLDDPVNTAVGTYTSYSDALSAAGTGLTSGDTGKLTDAGAKTTVYFLSDGVPTADGANSGTNDNQAHNLTSDQQTTWNTALETANVDKVFAVGVGTGIPVGDDDLEAVAHPNGNPNNDPVGSVTIVTNANDLADVLTGTVEGEPIEGNVLDGSIGVEAGGAADDAGDGPAHIAYFSYTDPNAGNGDKSITFTWTGNPLDALVVSGAVPISITDQIAVFETEHGKMTFYFKDGSGHDAGDFEFIPNAIPGNADATETFNYYTRDVDGDTEAGAPGDGSIGAGGATLVITINNINQGPVAVNDSANGTEDQVVTVPIATLLGNDTDPDGDSLTLQSVQAAVNGTVEIDGANVKFTPNAGYFGPASFAYTITDGTLTSTATVNINVAEVNELPVANDDILIIRDNDDDNNGQGNYTVQSAWFLRNDTDGDDTLEISQVNRSDLDEPDNNDNNPGSEFTIDPNDDNDFTYKASDGTATDQAIVDVQEDGKNGFDGDVDSEIIVGTGGDNTLNGNGGDDVLFGGDGEDTLNGGDGDDWLVYDNDDIFNGGADFDTLRFENDFDVNVDDDNENGSTEFVERVTNIEAIDLRNGDSGDDFGGDGEGGEGSGDDPLSAQDVIDITDADDTLYIMGDSGDQVRLDGDWNAGVTAQVNDPAHADINGLTFTQYTLGAATVYIQNTIDVQDNL